MAKPKIKIKKGYCLIIVTDEIKNLCKNCFFHNQRTEIVREKNINIAYPGCLRSVFMECPSKAHLQNGQNMIYKSVKINKQKYEIQEIKA